MMKNYNTIHKNILILIGFCLLVLLVRIKITQSIVYTFLIWNLFLAYLPYFISSIVIKRLQKSSKLKLIIALFVWLLFLPNAPYIITDFIHLNHVKTNIIWLDIFMLFAFALTGTLISISSLFDIYKIIKQKWNSNFATYFSIAATFLCGFGIYLGRFLRFNSWDVFSSPIGILKKSLLSINEPKAWFITLSFGSFLYVLFYFFSAIKSKLVHKEIKEI